MYMFGKDFTPQSEKDYNTIKGYLELLDRYEWHFMVTFTTSEYLSIMGAFSKMSRLSRYLYERQGEEFKIFWVAEPHESGSYHIHAMIIVKDAKARTIKSAWNKFSGTREKTNNRCKIKPYQKGKGGNVYTIKNIMKDNIEHGFVL